MANSSNKSGKISFATVSSIIIIAIVVFLFIHQGIKQAGDDAKTASAEKAAAGTMAVHFIDVDQGDCEFIELPNGETILIDAGERDQGQTVVNYINGLGYSEITYMIATHPHSDHIGGLATVLREFDVENVYMPNAVTTSSTYDKFLSAVENEGCKVIEAKKGVSIIDDGEEELYAYLIAPVSAEYDNLNNYSAVLMLDYQETAFLFMGDAEALVEKEITSDVSADVIKVGHHGSSTSSTEEFVKRVSPQYAVFECGVDNSYGHPHEEPLKRWQDVGAQILRKDIMGNIVITSNGSDLSISYDESSKNSASATASSADYKWVLNTNTKKIHYPTCSSVTEGSGKNMEYSNLGLEELQAEGYSPCGKCNPHE